MDAKFTNCFGCGNDSFKCNACEICGLVSDFTRLCDECLESGRDNYTEFTGLGIFCSICAKLICPACEICCYKCSDIAERECKIYCSSCCPETISKSDCEYHSDSYVCEFHRNDECYICYMEKNKNLCLDSPKSSERVSSTSRDSCEKIDDSSVNELSDENGDCDDGDSDNPDTSAESEIRTSADAP